MSGFLRSSLLETDLLFFDNTQAPFNNSAVRQAFAYALDKVTLAKDVMKDAILPAPTIIPPGMLGFQPNYAGLVYNPNKAKALLQSVYPDLTQMPTVTFSYPNGQLSGNETVALQSMWLNVLGIQVKFNAVELTAYNDLSERHQIQFGFTQWTADFPDPYDWLYLNLLSTAANNNGQWHNAQFDELVKEAETQTGDERIKFYNQAEQLAISDVGWLPVDHQQMAAVVAAWVHGASLNSSGLYFGDWSDVYILPH
jgi:ABC-type oligopeptide transport system substrate-binding subunit